MSRHFFHPKAIFAGRNMNTYWYCNCPKSYPGLIVFVQITLRYRGSHSLIIIIINDKKKLLVVKILNDQENSTGDCAFFLLLILLKIEKISRKKCTQSVLGANDSCSIHSCPFLNTVQWQCSVYSDNKLYIFRLSPITVQAVRRAKELVEKI